MINIHLMSLCQFILNSQSITFLTMFIPSESTIILAIVGMVGLFSTAIIWQRANRISSKYYGGK